MLPLLRDECSASVDKSHPFPSVQALYPDTALLSKEPSGGFGNTANAEDGDEVEAELDQAAE